MAVAVVAVAVAVCRPPAPAAAAPVPAPAAPAPAPTLAALSDNVQLISTWGSVGTGDGQFRTPIGVAVDRSANVYVADYGNHRVQMFSSDGEFLMTWGSFGGGAVSSVNPPV